MLAFLRMMVLLLAVLSVIYVALSLYSRRVRRGKLEAHWDRKGMTGDRDAFIRLGLKTYDASFRRKLILGVYIVPLTLIMIIVYVTNFM